MAGNSRRTIGNHLRRAVLWLRGGPSRGDGSFKLETSDQVDPPEMPPQPVMKKPRAGARKHPLPARQFERVVAAESSARCRSRGSARGTEPPTERVRRRRAKGDPSGVSLSPIYFAGRWPCAARRDASHRWQPLQAGFVLAGRSHLGGAGDA